MFTPLTNSRVSVEQPGQDWNGLGKKEEDSEEPSDGDDLERGKTRRRVVTQEQGQSQGRISKERP